MDMEKNQADRELALEALAFDPHSTALFRHLHLGDKEPAAKEGLAPFQAAHLVHCPHKILWKEGEHSCRSTSFSCASVSGFFTFILIAHHAFYVLKLQFFSYY
jgi:hypothetical protein